MEIRIELKEQKDKYDGCTLELGDRGIIQIVCENVDKKSDLIALITGAKDNYGMCVLQDVDTIRQPEEYRKKVDLIDVEKIDSTLTVKNYLTFYAMVKGNFQETTIDEMIQVFKQAEIESLLDRTVNDLTQEEKIKIRCLASYMRKITCLIGKDLLESLECKQRDKVLSFLEIFFRNKQCLCLLFENVEICKNKVDSVLVI